MRPFGSILCFLFILSACGEEKTPPPTRQPAAEAAPGAALAALEERVRGLEAAREEAPIPKGDESPMNDPVLKARFKRLEERLSLLEGRMTAQEVMTAPDKKPAPKPKPKPEAKEEPEPERKLIAKIEEAKKEPETPEVPPAAAAEETAPPLPDLEAGKDKPTTSPLRLVNIKIASEIDRPKRKPKDPGDTFESSVGRLYAWMALANPTDEKHTVVAIWKRDDKEHSRIELSVGPHASHWRTWAYTQIQTGHVGSWVVEVRDMNDVLIGSAPFTIK